jgi:hypothetical protein
MVDSLDSTVCDARLEAEGGEPFASRNGGLTICYICVASIWGANLVDLCSIYLYFISVVFVIRH